MGGWVGGSLPHCSAEKPEQEGVVCSDSVFIGMLRHITHATARSVAYGVFVCGILTSHLIMSVKNSENIIALFLFNEDFNKVTLPHQS